MPSKLRINRADWERWCDWLVSDCTAERVVAIREAMAGVCARWNTCPEPSKRDWLAECMNVEVVEGEVEG